MYPNFNVWKSTATNTIGSYPQSCGQGSNTKGPRPKKYQDILAVNEVKNMPDEFSKAGNQSYRKQEIFPDANEIIQ